MLLTLYAGGGDRYVDMDGRDANGKHLGEQENRSLP